MASDAALQDLKTAVYNAPNPEVALAQNMQSTGAQAAQQQLSGLRQAIGNTTNLLSQVAPRAMGGTKDSLMTTAGANKVAQQESAPLQEQLAGQGRNLGEARAEFLPKAQQAMELADQTAKQYQGRAKALQDIYESQFKQEETARAEANRQKQEAAQKAAAQRSASRGRGRGGGGGGRGAAPTRGDYDADLGALVAGMESHQRMPDYEDAVRQLVRAYAGHGISPQEIGETVYNIYAQHGPAPGAKFYG